MKKFNELTIDGQNILIERHRDINTCANNWADSIIAEAKKSGINILSFDVEMDCHCAIDNDDVELSWYWLDRLQEKYDTLTSDSAVITALSDYFFTNDNEMI